MTEHQQANEFDHPVSAAIYDVAEGSREDLDHYAEIVEELDARSVVDIGCGTGVLAILLAGRGCAVTGVDPAGAMLDVARAKPGADQVRWVHGTADALTALVQEARTSGEQQAERAGGPHTHLPADAALMTGNVAQVFLTDEAWATALLRARAALRPGGQLVFETRNPAAKAWLDWNRARSYKRTFIPDVGEVETWVELIYVSVGVDHDTAAFAVNAIRAWWYNVGAKRYPGSTRLLVTADAGGSNGYRLRTWKVELATLAADTHKFESRYLDGLIGPYPDASAAIQGAMEAILPTLLDGVVGIITGAIALGLVTIAKRIYAKVRPAQGGAAS